MEHGRFIEAAATTTNSALAASHFVFTQLIQLCAVLLQLTRDFHNLREAPRTKWML
jgi:hypothetical protein